MLLNLARNRQPQRKPTVLRTAAVVHHSPAVHILSAMLFQTKPVHPHHPWAPKAMRMTHGGTPSCQVFDMCPNLTIAWRSLVICSYSGLLPALPLVRALRASSPFFSIWLQVSWQLSWPQHSSLFKRLGELQPARSKRHPLTHKVTCTFGKGPPPWRQEIKGIRAGTCVCFPFCPFKRGSYCAAPG